MSDMNNPSDENTGALDDLWADALNEQKTTPTKSAADAVFQQLGGGDVSGALQDIDLIMDHQRAAAPDAGVGCRTGWSGRRTAGYPDQRLSDCPGRSRRGRG